MKNQFIIRDDDLSYWTKPQEIENLYKPFFDLGIKVCFSTIPKSIKSKNRENYNEFYQIEKTETLLHKNKNLVYYLKELIKEDRIEIMLHGYNHNYYFKYKNDYLNATQENKKKCKKLGGKILRVGEYNIQDFNILMKKTKDGKEYLEDILNVKIKNFVPPSNQISKEGIKAIYKNKLNLSGLIGFKYNREYTCQGTKSFLRRIIFRLINQKLPYPYVADYGFHKELAAFSITPLTNFNDLYNYMNYCKRKNIPIQLSTHYWELKKDLRNNFFAIINELKIDSSSIMLKEVLN